MRCIQLIQSQRDETHPTTRLEPYRSRDSGDCVDPSTRQHASAAQSSSTCCPTRARGVARARSTPIPQSTNLDRGPQYAFHQAQHIRFNTSCSLHARNVPLDLPPSDITAKRFNTFAASPKAISLPSGCNLFVALIHRELNSNNIPSASLAKDLHLVVSPPPHSGSPDVHRGACGLCYRPCRDGCRTSRIRGEL